MMRNNERGGQWWVSERRHVRHPSQVTHACCPRRRRRRLIARCCACCVAQKDCDSILQPKASGEAERRPIPALPLLEVPTARHVEVLRTVDASRAVALRQKSVGGFYVQ